MTTVTRHRRGSSLAALIDFVTGGSTTADTRKWAVDIAEETSKFRELEQLQEELREATVKLKTAREKVVSLQSELKVAKEARFDQDMSLIAQLRSKQNQLLQSINDARNSKKDLIRKSAVEMDRLRSIIRVLHEQIQCLVRGLDPRNVSPDAITNYMMYNAHSSVLSEIGLPDLVARAANPALDATFMHATFDKSGKRRAAKAQKALFHRADDDALDTIDMDALVGGDAEDDEGDDDDFPVCDDSCIDFRSVEPGDGVSFVQPYGRVEFTYLAYIHDRESGTCALIQLPGADASAAALAFSSAPLLLAKTSTAAATTAACGKAPATHMCSSLRRTSQCHSQTHTHTSARVKVEGQHSHASCSSKSSRTIPSSHSEYLQSKAKPQSHTGSHSHSQLCAVSQPLSRLHCQKGSLCCTVPLPPPVSLNSGLFDLVSTAKAKRRRKKKKPDKSHKPAAVVGSTVAVAEDTAALPAVVSSAAVLEAPKPRLDCSSKPKKPTGHFPMRRSIVSFFGGLASISGSDGFSVMPQSTTTDDVVSALATKPPPLIQASMSASVPLTSSFSVPSPPRRLPRTSTHVLASPSLCAIDCSSRKPIFAVRKSALFGEDVGSEEEKEDKGRYYRSSWRKRRHSAMSSLASECSLLSGVPRTPPALERQGHMWNATSTVDFSVLYTCAPLHSEAASSSTLALPTHSLTTTTTSSGIGSRSAGSSLDFGDSEDDFYSLPSARSSMLSSSTIASVSMNLAEIGFRADDETEGGIGGVVSGVLGRQLKGRTSSVRQLPMLFSVDSCTTDGSRHSDSMGVFPSIDVSRERADGRLLHESGGQSVIVTPLAPAVTRTCEDCSQPLIDCICRHKGTGHKKTLSLDGKSPPAYYTWSTPSEVAATKRKAKTASSFLTSAAMSAHTTTVGSGEYALDESRSTVGERSTLCADGARTTDCEASTSGSSPVHVSRIWECFTETDEKDGPVKTYETRMGCAENVTGLEQALLQMTEGEHGKVWIPSRLGYGRRGAGKLIPPGSDLIFMLNLLKVLPPDAEELEDAAADDYSSEASVFSSGEGGEALAMADVGVVTDEELVIGDVPDDVRGSSAEPSAEPPISELDGFEAQSLSVGKDVLQAL